MATSKRRRRPGGAAAAQRQAEIEELQQQLATQVEQLLTTEGWAAYLKTLAAFHSYSFNNLVLIWAQCPHATEVAGYRKWQSLGRQVRKGETGIAIRGFSTKKITDIDEETGDATERTQARFPILRVFDRSQTDPIPGEPDPEITRQLTGDDPAGIYEAVSAHITHAGWTVTRARIGGGVNGTTSIDGSKQIVIDVDLPPAQAAKTMLHEAAHALLHTGGGVDADPDELAKTYIAHRGRIEAEAESVAYVLANMAGLDTSDYSVGYVAGWTHGDLDLLASTAQTVQHGVTLLAPALFESDDEDEVDDTAA